MPRKEGEGETKREREKDISVARINMPEKIFLAFYIV